MNAKDYKWITLTTGIVAIGLLVAYVFWVPRLVANGVNASIFYIILVVWGLVSAAFLFGLLNSVAAIRGNDPATGSKVQLSGAAAVFALVVVGGFKLVPSAPHQETVVIRAVSAMHAKPLAGTIRLEFRTRSEERALDQNGEARFPGVPVAESVTVVPNVEGYDRSPRRLMEREVIRLELAPDTVTTVLTGFVDVLRGPRRFRITVSGQDNETYSDEIGRFSLQVRGRPGDQVRVRAFNDSTLMYDNFQVLPGPITIPIRPRQYSAPR